MAMLRTLIFICLLKNESVVLISAADHSQQSKNDACVTVDGRQCVFPFRFNGLSFSGCTWHYSTKAWCSTQVDNVTGVHIGGNKGNCGIGCFIPPMPRNRLPQTRLTSSEAEADLLKDIFIQDLGCDDKIANGIDQMALVWAKSACPKGSKCEGYVPKTTLALKYICGQTYRWNEFAAQSAIRSCYQNSTPRALKSLCEDSAWDALRGLPDSGTSTFCRGHRPSAPPAAPCRMRL